MIKGMVKPYADEGQISHALWKVEFSFKQKLSGEIAQRIADILEETAVSVSLHNNEATDGDDWTVSLVTMGKPDTDEIYRRLCLFEIAEGTKDLLTYQDIKAEKLPEKDWLLHVHENFPPVKIGSFFVYGSHYEGDRPVGFISLKIDAATAFGSGEHETTQGCLDAFEFLSSSYEFKNALDMGCGSGILAVGMTKLWPDIRVTAVDIDPESIVVTARHAEMNNAKSFIMAQAGDGYKTAIVAQHAPYDLIAANILANPLIEMAPDLYANLMQGGFCVLSGLLARQRDEVTAAHEKLGLKLVRAIEVGEWRALIFQK